MFLLQGLMLLRVCHLGSFHVWQGQLCALFILTPLLLKASVGGNPISIFQRSQASSRGLILWQHTCRPHTHNHSTTTVAFMMPGCLLQLSEPVS